MTEDLLRSEAIYFSAALFGQAASPALQDAYVRAHREVFGGTDPCRELDSARIVRLAIDVEALEIFFRFTRGKNILTQKLHILLYLSEFDSALYPQFINERSQRVRAWARLALVPFRSFWKFCLGYLLESKHRFLLKERP